MAKVTHPSLHLCRGVGDGVESQPAQLSLDWASWAFPPLCFCDTFFKVLSAHLDSPRVSPGLSWQKDLQQPQRETNLSSEQEEVEEV